MVHMQGVGNQELWGSTPNHHVLPEWREGGNWECDPDVPRKKGAA